METFSYDTTGNRTQRLWQPDQGFPVTTNYTIAQYSDLVTQVGGSSDIDYSTGGNMIDDESVNREYEWDHMNRLTGVENGSSTDLFDFEYGATGERLVQRSYSGGTTTRAFIYDREDVVVEFSNDTFSTVFRQYIHGPGIDEPLAILGEEEGEYTYYLQDGLGSVTGLVDAKGGDLLGIYDYAAFGGERKNTISLENCYRYTSREFVENDLYYYRARYMRPDLGRFMSIDPLGVTDVTNRITYAKDNPIEWSDPLGLFNCSAVNNSPENPCSCTVPDKGCIHPDCGKDIDHTNDYYCRKIWQYVQWSCKLKSCSGCDSCAGNNQPTKGGECSCTFVCRFWVINPHASVNPNIRPGMNEKPYNDPPYSKSVTVEGKCE